MGTADVLATKLHVPQPPATFVDRERLAVRLDEDLARGVTLVCAPAGFGKSALLAGWRRRAGGATAWLSLDAGDNDPVRFWRHVTAAIDRARDGATTPTATVLERGRPATAEVGPDDVAPGIVNALAGAADDVVLVLDDYHVIDDQRVHTGVGFLLDHAPATLHVVLATRSDPPLPLARWRARGELTEGREADLRFLTDEAAAFLREATGTVLSTDATATLTARTEGWAAGLPARRAVAAVAGRRVVVRVGVLGQPPLRPRLPDRGGLEQQPPSIRDFLVETSLLDRRSGPLCDAVTGRADSQAVLEEIERANLFLVALDDVRGWWRYHHLFADLLEVHLRQRPPARVRELHRRRRRPGRPRARRPRPQPFGTRAHRAVTPGHRGVARRRRR